MPDLSSITLPDNNTYDFKDAVARNYLNVFDLTATYDSGVYKITSPISGFNKYGSRLLRYKFLCFNIQLTDGINIRLIAGGSNLIAEKIYFVGYGPNVDLDGELCRYSVVIDEDVSSSTELVINIEKLSSKELPAVTSSDNGKFLQVVNGAWTAVAITDADGVSY